MITYFIICIEDGDLSAVLGLDKGNPGIVNDLVLASYKVKNFTNNSTNIDTLNKSISIPITNSYLDIMNNDIRYTYEPSDRNSPVIQYDQWIRYTDSNVLIINIYNNNFNY